MHLTATATASAIICNTLCLFVTIAVTSAASVTLSPPETLLLPPDAAPILSFKSKADLNNKLHYTLNEPFDYCQWQGITCSQGRIVKYAVQGFGLRGTFAGDTLSRLDQLRVLNLRNNSLSGPVPDFSKLFNLKSLFLGGNQFSGSFPASVVSLHRIRAIDLSFNHFTGSVPVEVTKLDRLTSFRLESNLFTGSLPAFNQSSLRVFNVSSNKFTGEIPVTSILSRFDFSSFSWNPNLCGTIINKDCRLSSPFFESSVFVPPPAFQNAESQGVVVAPTSRKNHKRTGLILGFIIVITFLIISIIIVFTLIRRKQNIPRNSKPKLGTELEPEPEPSPSDSSIRNPSVATVTMRDVEELISELPKVKKCEEIQRVVKKHGNLVFCTNEVHTYTLEQLMRASAELLGRGTIGTTYKAVLDNQLIVTVKRLDAVKTAITSGDVYELQMESVGHFKHPNLVQIQAYFQANEERLIVYDYQPNGSLFNLIHGSRSTRAKPLHWTSCLKIAEDVAQGLAYIHRESKLVHGNLKSSNVLLGADFEARLTDYCLAVLAHTSSNDDPDSIAYKAPEIRKSTLHVSPKSDVYAYGVLLLELLTGKHPSQHPFLLPDDMPNWVRAMRDDDDSEEDNRLAKLVEVASVCSLRSPEQRPVMWLVLRMIHEIKESVLMEDHTIDASTGFS